MNPQLFLFGYGFRPHASGEFDSESGHFSSLQSATSFPGPFPRLEGGTGKGPDIGWSRAHLTP